MKTEIAFAFNSEETFFNLNGYSLMLFAIFTKETISVTACPESGYTVDFRYLKVKGTLSNTLRYPYFDISDVQNLRKIPIEQPNFTNKHVI